MPRKNQKRPSSEELEAKADEILRKDKEDLLAQIAKNTEMLERIQAELLQPRNDPHYLQKLQENEANRNAIANKISQIDIVPDGNKSYLGVGRFTHGDARELALLLSSHFEAKIRQHE